MRGGASVGWLVVALAQACVSCPDGGPAADGPTDHRIAAPVADLASLQRRLGASPRQPTMVDFWAEWCKPCLTFQREVLPDPAVRQRLSEVQVLAVDLTPRTRETQKVWQRFGLHGLPSVLFFDKDGEELGGARYTRVEDAAHFVDHLDRVGFPSGR